MDRNRLSMTAKEINSWLNKLSDILLLHNIQMAVLLSNIPADEMNADAAPPIHQEKFQENAIWSKVKPHFSKVTLSFKVVILTKMLGFYGWINFSTDVIYHKIEYEYWHQTLWQQFHSFSRIIFYITDPITSPFYFGVYSLCTFLLILYMIWWFQ